MILGVGGGIGSPIGENIRDWKILRVEKKKRKIGTRRRRMKDQGYFRF
jgi:hypothetical protein